jgi:hypothetical protein
MKLFLKIIDIYKQNINLIKRHLVISLLCGLIELCLFLLIFKFLKTTLFASHFVSFCCDNLSGFIANQKYSVKSDISEFGDDLSVELILKKAI